MKNKLVLGIFGIGFILVLFSVYLPHFSLQKGDPINDIKIDVFNHQKGVVKFHL